MEVDDFLLLRELLGYLHSLLVVGQTRLECRLHVVQDRFLLTENGRDDSKFILYVCFQVRQPLPSPISLGSFLCIFEEAGSQTFTFHEEFGLLGNVKQTVDKSVSPNVLLVLLPFLQPQVFFILEVLGIVLLVELIIVEAAGFVICFEIMRSCSGVSFKSFK